MKRLLFFAGTLLALLLVSLVGLGVLLTTVSFDIDATPFKEHIIPLVQQKTGLEVGVEGEIRFRTGSQLGLSLQGVQVSNPAQPESSALLDADLVALQMETVALCFGKLQPTRIELEGVELSVDSGRYGRLKREPSARARAQFDAAEQRVASEVMVALARVTIVPDANRSRVDLDGTVDGQPLRLEGFTTTLEQLMNVEGSVPIELSGDMFGLKVSAEGTLALPENGATMDVALTVAGDSLTGLRPWVGETLAQEGPVQADIALAGSGGTYAISRLDVILGKRRFKGRGTATLGEAHRLQIRDGRMEYIDRRTGIGWQSDVASASLMPDKDELRFDFNGSVNGGAVRLEGRTMALSELMEAAGPIPFDLSGTVLDLRVEAKGSLAIAERGAPVDASITVSGQSLVGLAPWIGRKLSRLGPASAKLDLKGGAGVYEIAPFNLVLGEDRFEGRLGVDLSRPRPKLDLDLSVDKIDTRPLFRQQVSGGGRSTTSAGSEGKSRDGLFSDRPLELDRIGAADVTARIRIRSLITPYTSAQATDIDVKLVARRVRADLKAVGSGNRTITAALEIDGSNDPVAIALRVDGDKLAIDSLVATSAAEGMIRGEMGFAIDLRGRGDSVGRIMRSLSGSLLLLAEQGEADLTHLSRLTPGVRDLFGLVARPQAELAQVNCGIAAFELESGRTNVAILIDTTDSTVVAQGLLDLGAETLDVRVDPAPKGAHLEVPAPIVVRGQLANPEFRVEKSELLVSLADLVSKLAVPQLLLVDAFGAAIDENPCMKILSGVSAPAATGSRTGGLTESLSDTVGGAGAVVKGSAKAVERVGGAVIKGTGGIPEGIGGAAKGVFDSGRTEQSEE